jgi:putative NADH-flavin reductase
MKVALIGASGHAGSRILAELANRGHQVTAIVRHPDKIPTLDGVTTVKGDAHETPKLVKLLEGHDAVISSLHFLACDAPTLLKAIRQAAVSRYLVVGGAGSLEVRPGLRVIDTPEVPAASKRFEPRPTSTGRSCLRLPSSLRASEPAHFVWVTMPCYMTVRDAAGSATKTTPSHW